MRVVWEYVQPTDGLDLCEMERWCPNRARWVVQEGQPTALALPRVRRCCDHHRPTGEVVGAISADSNLP